MILSVTLKPFFLERFSLSLQVKIGESSPVWNFLFILENHLADITLQIRKIRSIRAAIQYQHRVQDRVHDWLQGAGTVLAK